MEERNVEVRGGTKKKDGSLLYARPRRKERNEGND